METHVGKLVVDSKGGLEHSQVTNYLYIGCDLDVM